MGIGRRIGANEEIDYTIGIGIGIAIGFRYPIDARVFLGRVFSYS